MVLPIVVVLARTHQQQRAGADPRAAANKRLVYDRWREGFARTARIAERRDGAQKQ